MHLSWSAKPLVLLSAIKSYPGEYTLVGFKVGRNDDSHRRQGGLKIQTVRGKLPSIAAIIRTIQSRTTGSKANLILGKVGRRRE